MVPEASCILHSQGFGCIFVVLLALLSASDPDENSSNLVIGRRSVTCHADGLLVALAGMHLCIWILDFPGEVSSIDGFVVAKVIEIHHSYLIEGRR